jgi:hypothetical protein
MDHQMAEDDQELGWAWFATEPPRQPQDDDLANAVAACFAGRQGDIVSQHLRSHFLDRRVPPSASDAELRHVEGQRAAITYLLRLAHPRG